MKKTIFMGLIIGAITTVMVASMPLAHAAITKTSIPISRTFFVPCANNGQGEVVTVSGTEEVLLIDNNNNDNGKFQFRWSVTGVGQTTGDRYQAVALTEETFTASAAQQFTENNIFFLIGQGPGNNLQVHVTSHITVNADGTLTANVDNLSIDACR
jgi:glucose/arabinose dehydrogenase